MSDNIQSMITEAEANQKRLTNKGWTKTHFALAIKLMVNRGTQDIEAEVERQLPLTSPSNSATLEA